MAGGAPLKPPPRLVPLSTRIGVRFGNYVQQAGWMLIAFSLAGAATCQPERWVEDLRMDRGKPTTTTGEVVSVRESRFRYQLEPLHLVRFRFQPKGEGDRSLDAECYLPPPPPEVGARVEVEYLGERPVLARIREGRRSPVFGVPYAFIVFPLTGLIVVLVSMAGARRALRLLVWGRPTSGKVVLRRSTEERTPRGGRTYDYEVSYRDGDGVERTVVFRSPDAALPGEGQAVTVLIDPDRAGEAVVLEALPCGVPVDSTGEIGPIGPRAWLWAALPAAVVAALASSLLLLL